MVRLLLGWDLRDPTCSFKLVDRIYVLAIGLRSNGLSVIPEITLKGYLSGGKVVFLPGHQSFRERGISQFSFLRETRSYAYVLIRAWMYRMKICSWF